MGIEPPADSPGKTQVSEMCGAKSGAPATLTGLVDPDLRRILAAWPSLPTPIRAAILALVGTAR